MTDFITADELAQIRADVLSLCPDQGDILSSSSVSDGAGGWTISWGTATADIYYRLDPIRQREQVAGAALSSFNQFQLTLPWDASITAENRFQGSDGQLYNVLGVDDSKSWQASVRCVVERL